MILCGTPFGIQFKLYTQSTGYYVYTQQSFIYISIPLTVLPQIITFLYVKYIVIQAGLFINTSKHNSKGEPNKSYIPHALINVPQNLL